MFLPVSYTHLDVYKRQSLTRTALQIARDVHEIKKDYNLIVRGLSSSMELNSENDGMSLDDIPVS